MSERFTIETVKRIHDEKNPEDCLEIGTDADTQELVEIRSMHWNHLTNKWDTQQRVVIDPSGVDTLIAALEYFKTR